jgi:hypothetical protein
MGHKVVINCAYGGFGLSDMAKAFIKERLIAEGRLSDANDFYVSDLARHDPALVECVESLGEDVNDRFSDLRVEELPDGCNRYYIMEYDGAETIITADDFEVIDGTLPEY